MNRIDGQRLNGIPIRPQASSTAPVEQAESGRPVRSDARPATESTAASALSAGSQPIDESRVAVIRKAVEQGDYPVIPARIADAMIAARYLLGTKA